MSKPCGGRFRVAPTCIAAAGVCAVAMPFFSLRPNRIVSGSPVFLAVAAPVAAAFLALLWVGFAVAASRPGRRGPIVACLLSLSVVAAVVVTAGGLGDRLVGSSAIARLGLGSGFWLTGTIAYVAYVVAAREAGLGPLFGAAGAAALVVLAVGFFAFGRLDRLSVVREWSVQRSVFAAEAGRHASLAGWAVLSGGVLGGAIGAASTRLKALRSTAFFLLNVVQTIPSLALFGFMILPLAALAERFPVVREWGIGGIGPAPALIALTLYAMLPIARNTCTALEGVPRAVLDAGRGMGMGKAELFLRVELPLAAPVAFAGVRIAVVQTVGNVAVAALIGAGGFGVFIFQGLGQFAMDMVLLGTLPVIAMALAADALLGALIFVSTPKPLRVVESRGGSRDQV